MSSTNTTGMAAPPTSISGPVLLGTSPRQITFYSISFRLACRLPVRRPPAFEAGFVDFCRAAFFAVLQFHAKFGYGACTSESARPNGATIRCVKNRPAAFTRRKLASVVRKAITSYYTQQEQQEIAQAAKRHGISMSSFVASAALKEARRTNPSSR